MCVRQLGQILHGILALVKLNPDIVSLVGCSLRITYPLLFHGYIHGLGGFEPVVGIEVSLAAGKGVPGNDIALKVTAGDDGAILTAIDLYRCIRSHQMPC